MSIAPALIPRTPAAPGKPVAPNHPPVVWCGQAAATTPPRASAEPELAVVAVLGYN